MSYDETERIQFFPKSGELRENKAGDVVHFDFGAGISVSDRLAAPSEPVRAVPPSEEHEVIVYKRQAVNIVAAWIDRTPDDIHAFQKAGKFVLDYPNPDEYGARLYVTGSSWWNVLRQIYSDLIRTGHVKPPNPQ